MCLNTGYPCDCLTDGNPCEPCRMTIKDREREEAHLSNDINVPSQSGSTCEAELNIPSNGVLNERGRHFGLMLSVIICLNILILGCALVSGSAYKDVNISNSDLQIFLIVLLLLTSIWMVYYVAFTARTENAIEYKDCHAGPVWLRGGLVLFGLLTIIMDIFKIASYVGYIHCDSAVKVAFPVVQLVFVLVQTYFLWIHAMDCVELQRNITRCGLMLTLSTNLVVWMTAVTEESLHQTTVPEYQATPLNSLDETYTTERVMVTIPARVLLVVAGLATFIVYEMEILKYNRDEDKKDKVVMIHFVMNIVIVTLMSVSTLIGCAIYQVDHRQHVSDKNPTRSLDVGLLVGASLGQFIISYFSIVAMAGTGAKGYLNGLNLAWAILMVIQLGLQNYFIIEGLHREPFHEVQPISVLANPYVLQPGKDMSILEESDMGTKPGPVLTADSLHNHTVAHRPKLLWKRWVLKEVCAFLLLGNVILWIMPAFGARPQFDHATETEFYQFNMWAAVVNVGLPFGIFYRMHSVASLFEVFLTS
ncbi:Proton channel OTOP3 [Dissostichus eleginoides]|uniref:Proton channel OTOP3 n=1 Tax=Dissostichus eleginoides TaxID=100907 RepID=A0AAD9B6S6_DISEL|nr:Proton channel OTOP3 [Dissostichus eleginoides]